MASDGSGRKVDRAADLRGERLGPVGMALENRDHRRVRDEAPRTGLARGAAEQGARFGGGTVAGVKLDQRGAGARANDLDEAEAVDGGALERQRAGQRRSPPRQPGARPCRRRSAGRSRSTRRGRGGGSPAPRRAPRQCASSSAGSVPSTSIRIIAGVGEMRSRRRGIRRSRCAASSSRSDQPAASSESLPGEGKANGQAFENAAPDDGDASLTRASGRFHASSPGIASRVISMLSAAPSVMPRGACGQEIFAAIIAARDGVAAVDADAGEPRRDHRSGGDDAVEQDPRFDDLAILDQRARGSRRSRARSAIQARG